MSCMSKSDIMDVSESRRAATNDKANSRTQHPRGLARFPILQWKKCGIAPWFYGTHNAPLRAREKHEKIIILDTDLASTVINVERDYP